MHYRSIDNRDGERYQLVLRWRRNQDDRRHGRAIVRRKGLKIFPRKSAKYLLASTLIVLAGVGVISLLYVAPRLQIEIALYATERSAANAVSAPSTTGTAASGVVEEDSTTKSASPEPTRSPSRTSSPLYSPSSSPTASATATTTETVSQTPTVYVPVYPTKTATQPFTPTNTHTRTLTAAPPPAATPTPTPEHTSSAASPQPATATPTAPTTSCSLSGNSAYEATLLNLINQARSDHGLDSLTLRSPLTAAARGHSADMACNNFISHTGSDGSRPADRVAAQGYSFTWIGENIYAGGDSYNAPEQAFAWWMNSTPHRENILGANYQSIGIGYQYNPDGQYEGCFTLVFTRP